MPRQYTPRIPCTCARCGRSFAMPPAEHRKSGGRFCSWQCRYGATPEDRFWTFVDKDDPSGCWKWTGGKDSDGYPVFSVEKRSVGGHRYAWQMVTGSAPNGPINHSCDTPACVRNDDVGVYVVAGVEYERRGHLWVGSPQANMTDCQAKGRRPSGSDRSCPSVLTEADVRAIRAERWGTQKEWAVKYGVSQSNIAAIRGRRSWKHIK